MEGEEERDGRKKRKGEMEGMKERKKMRKEGECEGRGGGGSLRIFLTVDDVSLVR